MSAPYRIYRVGHRVGLRELLIIGLIMLAVTTDGINASNAGGRMRVDQKTEGQEGFTDTAVALVLATRGHIVVASPNPLEYR